MLHCYFLDPSGVPEETELELSTITYTPSGEKGGDEGSPRIRERQRPSYDEEGWWKRNVPSIRRGSRWSISQLRVSSTS